MLLSHYPLQHTLLISLLLLVELIGVMNDNTEETKNISPSISDAVYMPKVTGSGIEKITCSINLESSFKFISAGTVQVRTLDCTEQLNSTVVLGQTTITG